MKLVEIFAGFDADGGEEGLELPPPVVFAELPPDDALDWPAFDDPVPPGVDGSGLFIIAPAPVDLDDDAPAVPLQADALVLPQGDYGNVYGHAAGGGGGSSTAGVPDVLSKAEIEHLVDGRTHEQVLADIAAEDVRSATFIDATKDEAAQRQADALKLSDFGRLDATEQERVLQQGEAFADQAGQDPAAQAEAARFAALARDVYDLPKAPAPAGGLVALLVSLAAAAFI